MGTPYLFTKIISRTIAIYAQVTILAEITGFIRIHGASVDTVEAN